LADTSASLLEGEESLREIVLPSEDLVGREELEDLPPWRRDAATTRALVRAGNALILFGALIASTYVIPDLEPMQPWRVDEDYVPFWNLIGRELLGQGAKLAQEEAALAQLDAKLGNELENEALVQESATPREVKTVEADEVARFPAYVPVSGEASEPATKIEFEDSLDSFFLALTRTDLGMKGAVTRVSHWGDSVLGNDGITAAVRNAMQARFGDAGHGFHAITQYDPSYRQKGVSFREISPWDSCYVIHQRRCGQDGFYGFGGAFGTSRGGAQSRFATAEEGTFGQKVARFDIFYAGMPRGGNLSIQVDREPAQSIATDAKALDDRFLAIDVEDGPHRLTISAAGGGQVRVYGVALERRGPGVVWDGMGLIGSFTSRLTRQNPEHFARQVAHRDPDLVVLMFGGNDMTREKSDLARTMAPFERDLEQLVSTVRAGKPEVACMIMAPIDHGERVNGRIVGRAIVPRMVEASRRVAAKMGCAFFDTLTAMGGSGSIARWFRHEPRWASGDLSHPTHHGHRIIGAGLLYKALIASYRAYREKMAGQPLPADPSGEVKAGDKSGQVEKK
jgi:lysophospholipase L1-like esterase